jgi:hypothetical protein
MSGDPQSAQWAPLRAAENPLPGALTAALSDGDWDRARELLAGAQDSGHAPVALFVEVMRPALRAARAAWPEDSRERRERDAVRTLAAVFAELLGAARASGAGAGRRAVLIGDVEGPGSLDCQVLVELLERDGWMVSAVAPDRRDAGRLVAQLEPAAVVLAGEVADGVALMRVRRELQRLSPPPLIVRCLMGAEAQGAPAVIVEVDASEDAEGVAIDVVVERLARRFSDAGMPAWGVSMRREADDVLVVTPSGHLDADTSDRLREVVESRRGSFSSVVLNLGELSSSEEPALGELLSWVADEGWPEPGATARA